MRQIAFGISIGLIVGFIIIFGDEVVGCTNEQNSDFLGEVVLP